jgi:hypothetical protein
VVHPDGAIDLAVDQEVAVFLVMEKGLGLGRVERRIADLVSPDMEVVMEETADLPRPVGDAAPLPAP